MVEQITSRRDPQLIARVVSGRPLYYGAEPDAESETLPYVRAGSSLVNLSGRIAVVGDDTNFVALIEPASRRVERIVLPAGHGGQRLFDDEHDNKRWKLDLEACVVVPDADGELFVAFGSGSGPEREQIVVLTWTPDGKHDVAVYRAPAFYASLRAEREFTGSGLNVEGSIYLESGALRLFQRGNAEPREGLEPVDATCDVSWPELWEHLQDPEASPPPRPSSVVQYRLGQLDGVRLTFSDAEPLHAGGVLYAASAEGPPQSGQDGPVVGSALGVIEPTGEVRWTELTDADGGRFQGKVEGLYLDPHDPYHAYFVVDLDDPEEPSRLYEAMLSGPWYREVS